MGEYYGQHGFYGLFNTVLQYEKYYFYFIIFILFFLPIVGHTQIITTYAGNGIGGNSGDGGMATIAKISNPSCVAFDREGNFYFSQQALGSIRKVDITGTITTIAGPGTFGVLGDGGLATAASFDLAEGLAFDTTGNLYIVDHQHYRVRKIDKVTGIITTIAGSGVAGDGGDGADATNAKFIPADIRFDRMNNLYISDNTYHRIRKVNSDGIISTYAGTGIAGFSGDYDAATTAQLNRPTGICFDNAGNLLVADAGNKRIRKIDITGTITTIAGTGIGIYNGDGIPATVAQFGPNLIAIDRDNNLYVADSNQRIRVINSLGIINTVAGTGTGGYNSDDIPATAAQINSPGGIAIDACDNVYFADVLNNRIRKVIFTPICTPADSVSLKTTSANKNNQVSVYPNPAHDEVNVTTGITITNLLGQQVRAMQYNSAAVRVDVRGLPAGVYFMKVTDEYGVQTVERIVKE